MARVQVDEHDVPLTKLVVWDAEVLWNPFDDLQPRVDKEDKKAAKAEAEALQKHRSVVSLQLIHLGQGHWEFHMGSCMD